MTILGYNTVGTLQDWNSSGTIIMCGYFVTDASGGVPSDGQTYFDGFDTPGTQKARMLLYDDDVSPPGTKPSLTLRGITDEVLVDGSTPVGSWRPFTAWTQHAAPTLAATTNYWVGFWWGDNTTSARWIVRRDLGAAPANFWAATGITYSSSSDPSVGSWADQGSHTAYSFYFNYAPGGPSTQFPPITAYHNA